MADSEFPKDFEERRRGYPLSDYERWRGDISARVRQHDRDIKDHDEDLRTMRQATEALTQTVVTLRAQIEDAREDIAASAATIAQGRQNEVEDLKQSIANSRNLIIGLVSPLIVAVVAGLIIWAVTGSHHP